MNTFYGVFLFLLMLGSTYGTLKNPSLINSVSFVLQSSPLSVIRVDDTTTSLFVFAANETEVYNATLFIFQLDPQSGEIIADSAVTNYLGIVNGLFTSSPFNLVSPMPNKAALIVNWSCENSTVLLYGSSGILEQVFQFDGGRTLVKPVAAPGSPLFNSLFVVPTQDNSCGFGQREVAVLTWNGSQYISQQYKYLDFEAHAIVGDYVYGTLSSNLTYLCQYELQQVMLGNATPIACDNDPNMPKYNPQNVISSRSATKLVWIGHSLPIRLYEIPKLSLAGKLEYISGKQQFVDYAIQFSEYGDLLFGALYFQGHSAGFTFQDISNLAMSQPLSAIDPVAFTQNPQFPYAVTTHDTRFTYMSMWNVETATFYVVGYDSTPIVEPDIVASIPAQYLDVIGDTTRGVIWAAQSNRIDALQIGDSFIPSVVFTDSNYSVCSSSKLQNWNFSNSSKYLILSISTATCVYDLSLWPKQDMTLLASFTFDDSLELDVGWVQLMWIDGQLYKIRVQDHFFEGYQDICIFNTSTVLSCQYISIIPIYNRPNFRPWGDFGTTRVAMVTRGLEIMVIAGSPNTTTDKGTSLYSYLVNSNDISMGAAVVTEEAKFCQFVESTLVLETEIWFLCIVNSSKYFIYQFDTVQRSLKCSLPTNVSPDSIKFSWTIRDDGTLLATFTSLETRVYDITACHTNQSPAFPKLISVYSTQDPFNQVTLLYTYNTNFQIYLSSTGIEAVTDCRSGMQPNSDNFCSQCTPGTAGPMCEDCPGGYICENYGISVPYLQCPPGYFCVTGSNSSSPGTPGGPVPCSAGTYCPGGIAIKDVNLSVTNTPHWCPEGYYCPQQSAQPDLFSCNKSSTTIQVGGRSIEDCVCNDGFWGYNGSCKECPIDCKCNGNVIVGCYIDQQDMVMCPPYSINGSTPCNPYQVGWNGTGDFPCAEGYTGRLCSDCIANHYRQSRKCVKCSADFKWTLPLAYAGISVLAMLYVWSLDPGNSAVILILAFHFQTLSALINGGNQWQVFTSSILNNAQSVSSFSLKAIECIIPWWNAEAKLLYFLLLPVLYLFFAACSSAASFIFNKLFIPEPRPASYFKIRATKMVVYLFSFNYFSVVLAILSVLATHKGYLTVYPWLKYSTPLASFAYVGLVIEVIAIPLLIAGIIWKNRTSFEEEWMKEIFGSLYCMYIPSRFYWELVIVARRVAVAFIVTFSPYNSPMLMLGSNAVVLIYMWAQINAKPYVRSMDNILETTSHFILVCTLSISLMAGYPSLRDYTLGLVYTAIFLNTVFLGIGLIYTVFSYREKIRKFGGRIKEGIGSIQAYFGANATPSESVPLIIRSHNE